MILPLNTPRPPTFVGLSTALAGGCPPRRGRRRRARGLEQGLTLSQDFKGRRKAKKGGGEGGRGGQGIEVN